MANKITYQSTYDDVGWSLRDTLDEIEQHGETIQLKFDMLYKYGRLHLLSDEPDKAYQIFQHCSIHAIENGISDADLNELYYWTTRCVEEQGNKERALELYLMLLEKVDLSENNDEFVNAVLDRLTLFGNITALVEEYKQKREEEMNNPQDLLGQAIKVLREMKK